MLIFNIPTKIAMRTEISKSRKYEGNLGALTLFIASNFIFKKNI